MAMLEASVAPEASAISGEPALDVALRTWRSVSMLGRFRRKEEFFGPGWPTKFFCSASPVPRVVARPNSFVSDRWCVPNRWSRVVDCCSVAVRLRHARPASCCRYIVGKSGHASCCSVAVRLRLARVAPTAPASSQPLGDRCSAGVRRAGPASCRRRSFPSGVTGAIRSAQFCVPTGFGNHVAECLPRCTRRGRVHRGIPAATLVLISVTGNSCRRLLNEGAENQHENVRVNSIGMTLTGRRSSLEDQASQRPTLSLYLLDKINICLEELLWACDRIRRAASTSQSLRIPSLVAGVCDARPARTPHNLHSHTCLSLLIRAQARVHRLRPPQRVPHPRSQLRADLHAAGHVSLGPPCEVGPTPPAGRPAREEF